MLIEKETIRCEAVFDDDRTHRYFWKRVWNKDLPLAAVVMLNPCQADTIITDTTTSLVVNNIAGLEKYGGVVIVNLYSKLTTKLEFRWHADEELNDPENDDYIRKAAEGCETVILAWGRGADSNQRIAVRAQDVLTLLQPFAKKLFVISDGERRFIHPLTPTLRNRWLLEPYTFECPKSADDNTDVPALS